MRHFFALALLASSTATLAAQTPVGKRPLTQEDFDHWRAIQSPALSPDGRWAAYTLAPQVGDGDVVIRATTGTTEHKVPRGYVGRPQLRPAADSGFTAAPAQWTADSKHLVFLVYPTQAESERARRERRRAADQPKNGLAIFSVAQGQATTIPKVRSFRMARESGTWLAYLLEPDSAVARPAGGGDSTSRARPRRPEPGSTLVLRNLTTGADITIGEVATYAIDDSAKWLAYSVHSRNQDGNGAYLRSLATGEVFPLLTGPGTYGQVVFDRSGAQAAFVSDKNDATYDKPRFTAYLVSIARGRPQALAVATPDSVATGMLIAERGRLDFTRDGSALQVPVALVQLDSIPADSLADKAIFDLWNYQDPKLQPQQKVEANRERNATYVAVYQPKQKRFLVLGSPDLPQVALGADGRYALGVTSEPYRIEAMWGEGGSDIYAIDAQTGVKSRIVERAPFNAQLSPGGHYVMWFAEGGWRSYSLRTGKTAELTTGLQGVRFDQETWDTPSQPSAWGVGGWTTGDRSVLVYDRYDVWDIDPSGQRPARMVTDSAGRKAKMVFRVLDLDRDDPFIDPAQPLLLRGFGELTKQAGFWTDRLDRTAPPARILMSDNAYGTPSRAKNAETYLVTRSTFREFPDLWTGPRLDALTRITDANPQQAQVAWGTAELVSWLSDDGVPLQGLLFKPDGFDPSKQYPMVVYYYEQLSNGLHNYVMTYPRNTTQPTYYASNGYLVFFPDIAYTTGYPGPDAMKSIVPGVQALVAKGFVKPDGIGLAGQSWGGYQTAWVITRTTMFKAAMAGAPVANMTSAYGGIRWQSGLARAFQYEKTQSRIGGSLWEYPLRYLENSPLFAADRIETPLLIMSNDNDGAVPWYQGIEMFVALRRLGKEVYMVSYNGDEHNPTKRANQADIARRTMEFFNHHLRGAPMPDWMEHGIPYRLKGRDQIAPAVSDPKP